MNAQGNDLSWYFKIQIGMIAAKVLGLLPLSWAWVMAPMWLFPVAVLGLLVLTILLAEIGIIPRSRI